MIRCLKRLKSGDDFFVVAKVAPLSHLARRPLEKA